MITAAVGSTNPVKVNAARIILGQVYAEPQVSGVKVPSGVPEQPWGHEQTRKGAFNRAQAALAGHTYGIGIESGLVRTPHGLMTVNWCMIIHQGGVRGLSQGFGYVLPPEVAALIEEGHPLGEAIDRVTGQTGIRQGPGASGIVTGNLVTRQAGYQQLIMLALAPFRRPDLY
jgi:inosine/xanthosine triphosphatase